MGMGGEEGKKAFIFVFSELVLIGCTRLSVFLFLQSLTLVFLLKVKPCKFMIQFKNISSANLSTASNLRMAV